MVGRQALLYPPRDKIRFLGFPRSIILSYPPECKFGLNAARGITFTGLMPKTESLEVQTEPLTPHRELTNHRSRRTTPVAGCATHARLAHESCDDETQEPPQPPQPTRMEQARDDLLQFMERPCWARLVCHTSLEPYTSRPQASRSAAHTRVRLALDRRSCTCFGSSVTARCSSSS